MAGAARPNEGDVPGAPFSRGQRVRIREVPLAEARELQRGHGGWNPSMEPFVGRPRDSSLPSSPRLLLGTTRKERRTLAQRGKKGAAWRNEERRAQLGATGKEGRTLAQRGKKGAHVGATGKEGRTLAQ